jgi:sec-independent protein translocase protein TatB
MAAKAGRALNDLRRIADGAKADLRQGLGPEFSDVDFDDLHPRRFAQKHLLGDLNRDDPGPAGASTRPAERGPASAAERPPYDVEAT